MIAVLLIWSFVLVIFISTGAAFISLIHRTGNDNNNARFIKIDEAFFMGFLTLSPIAGFLSIWIPLNIKVLLVLLLLSIILLLFEHKKIMDSLNHFIDFFLSLTKIEKSVLVFLLFLVISAIVYKITWGDTESYHAQAIQWIRKYSVVPGLGNIHGRFAYNSMFFIISGLFSFQSKDVLIFPLNGICYLMLIYRLFILYSAEYNKKANWLGLFYILMLLISLLVMLPNLNSPSPDVICAILIMYLFTFLVGSSSRREWPDKVQFLLIILIIFNSISFKVSSIFLVFAILFIYRKPFIRNGLILIGAGIVVLAPFLIRNYYLSGYLLFPYPEIDIFNVDWKIPYQIALAEKLEIKSWARIAGVPSSEVLQLTIEQWLPVWYRSLNFMMKSLIFFNILLIAAFVIMIIKKELFLIKLQLFIFVNIVFWFIMAPDPRFLYGILFAGFALSISYLIGLKESSFRFRKYINICLIIFLVIIAGRRIKFPAAALQSPYSWIIPAPFGTVETKTYMAGFEYRVPVPEGGCFNVEIPCVPYPLSNIELRGEEFQDGFRIIPEK